MNKLIVFLDTIGRTIIGEHGEEADSGVPGKIAIHNPAILNIIPTEQGSMQVQIIPIMFKELQADRDQSICWYYDLSNITMSDEFSLDFKIASQYNQIFAAAPVAPQGAPQPAAAGEGEVIKLFDDWYE